MMNEIRVQEILKQRRGARKWYMNIPFSYVFPEYPPSGIRQHGGFIFLLGYSSYLRGLIWNSRFVCIHFSVQ